MEKVIIGPLEEVKSPMIKKQLNADTSQTDNGRNTLYRRSNRRRRGFGSRCTHRRCW